MDKSSSKHQVDIDRRTFLKLAGFSSAVTVVAGCQQASVEKAIPLLIKPEEITPGLGMWYASTCGGCNAACGVLAKNRDGRPVKLEGNPEHPLSRGGLCAAGQASLLSLYDSQRLHFPMLERKESSWEVIDRAVIEECERIKATGGAVRILSGSVTSPTTLAAIARFVAGFKDARHVVYDALSVSAILDAHERTHGARVLPHYHFDRAEAIVSFDADFLGTWISPVEFTAGDRVGRSLEGTTPKFSHHVQIESRLSLTGSNADRRVRVTPLEMREMIRRLAARIASLAGELTADSNDEAVAELAIRLWKSRGKCLVVCGVNDLQSQLLINDINHQLGNYGSTMDIDRPSRQMQGSDSELRRLLDELGEGRVAALLMHNCNPVYDLPNGADFADHLKRVSLAISTAERLDETASATRIVCPEPHCLERWSDAEPVAGTCSIGQPAIAPFGKTRPLAESLSAWMGMRRPMYDLIRDEWERNVFTRQTTVKSFRMFWDKSVHDGFAMVDPPPAKGRAFNRSAVGVMKVGAPSEKSEAGVFDLVLYPTVVMLDGRHAHNPWLQELPDPVTKIVWDNYASISPVAARQHGLQESDVVRLEANGRAFEVPVHIQPGQHERVVAVALGYGRKDTDRFTTIGPQWFEAEPTVPAGGLVGKNAAPFLTFADGSIQYDAQTVSITKTGKKHLLASTQEHHSLHVPEHLAPKNGERRPIVQETTYHDYRKNPGSGSFSQHELLNMWPEEHKYSGHRWGMAIDLTACTGCSACVIGCMAENNIPVVGKDEVMRNREMTWIRIDRYYTEKDDDVTVAHQPMMCQHCDHAPCETVCPVLATVHSDEGLNQQVYNRCVGTRYCSNNCPYKVRRFNWFEYEHGDDMHKLVLNPDITVRERGVMEKCSLCIQRIQEGKIEAKRNGVPVRDGSVKPACQQSCPANAIVFGDMNDPESEITRKVKDPRYYRVLEEIGVRPSVGYMTLVRNDDGGVHHG